MRFIFVALMVLAAAGYQLHLFGIGLLDPSQAWPANWTSSEGELDPRLLSFGFLLLAGWLLIEGVLQLRHRGARGVAATTTSSSGQGEVTGSVAAGGAAEGGSNSEQFSPEAKQVFHKKDRTISQLNLELEELQLERGRLQEALGRSESELAAHRNRAPAVRRSSEVDAEIVNVLAAFQEKGRLLDFLLDDVSRYPDNQVGAAARVVHAGCSKAIKDGFDIAPVHSAAEGENIALEPGFSGESYRLLGSVGEPPYKGRLVHHGWKVTAVKLPRVVAKEERAEHIVAPAEVEL